MAASPITWIDGEQSASLPLPDRGLDFGDGLFETFLLANGAALFPDLHFARLARGLQRLGYPDCVDSVRAQLAAVETFAANSAWPWAALRITVTRGSGPRGYAAPQVCQPRIIATATALERDCSVLMSPAQLLHSSIELSEQPLLAGVKHLNRLEQVLAANETRDAGVDEALMTTCSGSAVAVTAGNIFVLSQSVLYTPPLERCGVAGTRREKIMNDWGRAVGLEVRERVLTVGDIEQADECFYCNSLIGLRPVGSFGDVRWNEHKVCEELFAAYLADIQRSLPGDNW